MAQIDRDHEKRLKEAEKAYNRWKKAYLSGKISKDELKEKLRPYKYELHELNLVKLKEGDLPPSGKEVSGSPEGEEQPDSGKMDQVAKGTFSPWRKRSSLTIEEIEKRIDLMSLGQRPSEALQMLYEKRYGEQLEPPEDIVFFTEENPASERDDLARQEWESGLGSKDDESVEEEGAGKELETGKRRRPLLRGLLRRRGSG